MSESRAQPRIRSSSEEALDALAGGALSRATENELDVFESAWPLLLERVGVFLRALGVPTKIREDCGQNALVRIWKGRGSYRGSSREELFAWVYRIVQRESLRLGESAARAPRPMSDRMPLRTEAVTAEIQHEDWLISTPPCAPDTTLLASEEQEVLAVCIAELAEPERAVVELCYAARPSTEREAATVLGVSKSYVNVLRQRALAALFACLRRKGIEG